MSGGPRILVRRHGALGDVLLTTPVVARFATDMIAVNPEIDVETVFTQVYENNPFASTVWNSPRNDADYDRVVDLNGAYEIRPQMHIVDAYMAVAFGDDKGNKRVVFGTNPAPPKELIAASNVVSIHAASSWPSRTMPEVFWNDIAVSLISMGYIVQFIGSGNDYRGPKYEKVVDCVGTMSLRECTEAIGASTAFICADSSLMHFAGATDTPIVPVFTSTRPEYRMPYRNGQLGWRCTPIVADVDCRGCLHDAAPPVTWLTCKRGDLACIDSIDPKLVVDAIVAVTAP